MFPCRRLRREKEDVAIAIVRFALFLALLVVHVPSFGDDVVPLLRAHAHNDYFHERPLLDALAHGFCSVEVDIWLIDGELRVAHERNDAKPGQTLQSLYLDPLRERVKQNGGSVYPGGPEMTLLIDIKGNGRAMYPVLRKVLEEYADILTTFTDSSIEHRAVRAIISGSRPLKTMRNFDLHYAAYDGRLTDLGSKLSSDFMPLISSSWARTFSWQGVGPIPNEERVRLRAIVTQAHAEGRKIRFWATPDRDTFWKELLDADVDYFNADDLEGLRDFFLTQAP